MNDCTEFGELIFEIKRLTSDNLHTDVLIHVARYFGHTDLLDKLIEIKRQHYRLGYMSGPLLADRETLAKALKGRIVPTLTVGEQRRIAGLL